ncbi:MAG: hypothetical protein PHW95_05290 [Patescibacteria group bacterium]|nr:hypothetical protein [Patescibacteria group bacterium]
MPDFDRLERQAIAENQPTAEEAKAIEAIQARLSGQNRDLTPRQVATYYLGAKLILANPERYQLSAADLEFIQSIIDKNN